MAPLGAFMARSGAGSDDGVGERSDEAARRGKLSVSGSLSPPLSSHGPGEPCTDCSPRPAAPARHRLRQSSPPAHAQAPSRPFSILVVSPSPSTSLVPQPQPPDARPARLRRWSLPRPQTPPRQRRRRWWWWSWPSRPGRPSPRRTRTRPRPGLRPPGLRPARRSRPAQQQVRRTPTPALQPAPLPRTDPDLVAPSLSPRRFVENPKGVLANYTKALGVDGKYDSRRVTVDGHDLFRCAHLSFSSLPRASTLV